MNRKILIYIIVIVIILVAVFFSQQAYSRDIFKNVLSYMSKYGGASLMGAFGTNNSATNSSTVDNNATSASAANDSSVDSFKLPVSAYDSLNTKTAPSVSLTITDKVKMAISGISESVTGGLKSGGQAIANTVSNVKENISTAENNVVNYFSGISNAVQGKTNNTACEK